LRFTKPQYLDGFRQKASELLCGLWSEVRASDNDPATPAKRR